ncbi:MAG TPA: alpha/beta hydrolase domain-containing protein [Candidatus Acidoferrales bacterium]|nr:alpha/beta hydrolase domain-containing protein [Candidatus Acidoferrales bacterium]
MPNFSSRTFLIAQVLAAALLITALGLLAAPAQAKVKSIVIDKSKSESPTYGGKSFGAAGQYEKIVGHAYGELDPKDPHNSIITDIQLAPRNTHGMVEYVATFTLFKPMDISKASNVLLYDVVNRGRKLEQVGSDRGYSYLFSGWQGDIPENSGPAGREPETIQVPVAHNPDGSTITGPVLARFMNIEGNTAPLIVYSRPVPYLPATLDTNQAKLISFTSENSDGKNTGRATVSSTDWAWADCTKTPFPGEPDPHKICLKNGFDPTLLYQLVFQAKDPLVLGIGFAATRDLTSFFRHAGKDDDGTPNPLAGKIQYAVSQGSSQSGRFIRTFIHLGFNQDEEGRIVWDGAIPHIAAGQMPLNVRFALPDGASYPYEIDNEGVMWWGDYPDKLRSRKSAGLLDRCRTTKTCPKIMEEFGSTEFWDLRMSPVLVGTNAKQDLPQPENVRSYYFPGTTHGGGAGGFSAAPPAPARGRAGVCELPANPNPESDTMRALLEDMVEWIEKGTAPPGSQYPRLSDGTLVHATKAAVGFPDLPMVTLHDNFENPLFDYQWGPNFHYDDLSGVVSEVPPATKQVVPLLVPKVNADGNEVAGVASVLHQAPLGTYLGWNIVPAGFLRGQMCAFTGGFIPFAETKDERMAAHDPRPSLEERYGSQKAYVAAVRAAADKAVRDRFLLPEDADRLVQQAAASHVLPE